MQLYVQPLYLQDGIRQSQMCPSCAAQWICHHPSRYEGSDVGKKSQLLLQSCDKVSAQLSRLELSEQFSDEQSIGKEAE